MSQYEELGVDPHKESVKNAFKKLNENEVSRAFVNMITDPLNPTHYLTQHQDGDGSKLIQRFLNYYESGGQPGCFQHMADDALSMNTGDIAAAGFVSYPIIVTNVLDIGRKDVKDIVMKEMAERFAELRELYAGYGMELRFLGGETADLLDQVKSAVLNVTVTSWVDKAYVVSGNIRPGDIIFGFPSTGCAIWEKQSNPGIMSNGLTLSRKKTMAAVYNAKYPFLKRDGDFYSGQFLVGDRPDIMGGMTAGEMLTFPTRQWAIVIKILIDELKEAGIFHMLHGITMNTGGGCTKIKNIGEDILYVKVIRDVPPAFRFIQQESGESWEDMFVDFNCGIGLDIIGANCPEFHSALKRVSDKIKLPLLPALGTCYSNHGKGNAVLLDTPYGSWEY